MNLDKKRWAILIVSCLMNLCIGSLYAWSVFAGPMSEYLFRDYSFPQIAQAKAGILTLVFMVAHVASIFTMVSGGKISDNLGPRRITVIGGLLFGTGFFLSGFAESLTVLILAYGLGCGLGMGLVYAATINNSVKFFPDKRGLAAGLITASYGLSAFFIPPIAQKIIESYGVLAAFRILGLVFGLIIIGGSFLMEKVPLDYMPAHMELNTIGLAVRRPVQLSWREVIREKSFYIIFSMMVLGGLSGLMIISQMTNMAEKTIGLSQAEAVFTVSMIALFNSLGRIVAGYLSDKIGRIRMIQFAFVSSIIGLSMLFSCTPESASQFFVGISIIGICFGTFLGVFPGLTADRFGSRHNGVNYGIIFAGYGLSGIIGPMVAAKTVIETNSYQTAYTIALIAAIIGFALTLIISKDIPSESH